MIRPLSASNTRAGSPMPLVTKGARYLVQSHSTSHHLHAATATPTVRSSRPLVGNFEENILHNRLKPDRTVDGYTVEVRAACSQFQPSPFKSGVRMSFYSMGDSFPYIGRVPIGSRGYRIPKRGTIQVTLFNPHGTLVKLFLLFYDLNDMPPSSQTFLRQKTLILPKLTNSDNHYPHYNRNDHSGKNNPNTKTTHSYPSINDKKRVKYMIQLNIVSSKSGRIYLNRDVRLFISKKTDLETASQLVKQDYEVKAFDEMPNNPRYFDR